MDNLGIRFFFKEEPLEEGENPCYTICVGDEVYAIDGLALNRMEAVGYVKEFKGFEAKVFGREISVLELPIIAYREFLETLDFLRGLYVQKIGGQLLGLDTKDEEVCDG